MPTQLPNGLLIYNVTPHDLHFWCEGRMVVSHSDAVVNAYPIVNKVEEGKHYTLHTHRFVSLAEGEAILNDIQEKEKNLDREYLIVGSIIAAQAYPGVVVAPKPVRSYRYQAHKGNRLNSPNDFTVYQKERHNGSKE